MSDTNEFELPEFFQTTEFVQFDVLENNPVELDDEFADERITRGLSQFFDGVHYIEMGEYFYSFEGGTRWTNPVFSDEFTSRYLPFKLKYALYELTEIFDISRTVMVERNGSMDARYGSLCDSQQSEIREAIQANEDKMQQLDDLYNRLVGYRGRTPNPEIKFLLNQTIYVIQEVLCKNTNYTP